MKPLLSLNVCRYPFNSAWTLITSLSGSWEESYDLANAIALQMTLDEKIGIVSGTGQLNPNRWLCALALTLTPDHRRRSLRW